MPTPAEMMDRLLASDAWKRTEAKARKAETHWDEYFRSLNPSFAQLLALEAAIRLMHEGNRP